MISTKYQNEAHTLPSVVVCTSFKIFRALFDVRPRMRRLSQALQIECIFERNGSKQSQGLKESAR